MCTSMARANGHVHSGSNSTPACASRPCVPNGMLVPMRMCKLPTGTGTNRPLVPACMCKKATRTHVMLVAVLVHQHMRKQGR